MIETKVSASLTAFGYPPRPATAVVVTVDPPQRIGRIVAALGVFWGLALIGLFIPLAHFILVPTFVTAGIVAAVKRAREDRRLVSLHGVCPRCGSEQDLEPGGRFASGRGIVCLTCHGNLTLIAEAAAGQAA